MPIAILSTNRPIADAHEFASLFTKKLGAILDKAPESIYVKIEDKATLARGGEHDDRVIYLHIKAVNVFNPESNVRFSAEITQYLVESIQASPDKTIIEFTPLDPNFVGKQFTTIAESLKSSQST
uniref:L-dopachrome isomerase n=1 Tax=Panagrellus redivivus TaxID=6233 RepID=A0A7E4V1H5_PANRE